MPLIATALPAHPTAAFAEAAFAGLMAEFGPFEPHPDIAVAVSGGSDSMALCLLADRWARARGGRARAVTVDHGLRPQSAEEARLVGDWLAARRIPHVILAWWGTKPQTGIQAAARAARYALLEGWCRDAGVLHLLLGHTRDDQLETALLRLGRATGIEGAAGMSAVVERPCVRLLRPCLGIGRDRLRAVLAAEQQDWVEDASNSDRRYARVRARDAIERMDERGGSALARGVNGFGRLRLALEAATAVVLADGCWLHPAGFATFEAAAWRLLPDRLAGAVLHRLCTAIAGRLVPPRDRAIRDAVAILRRGDGKASVTLAGCRLLVGEKGLLVCRESRHLPAPLALSPGLRAGWDGRFKVAMADGDPPRRPLHLDYLGRSGWAEVAERAPALRFAVPPAARQVLPAIWDNRGVLRVPHLAYNENIEDDGWAADARLALSGRVTFAPAQSLSGNGFRLAPEPKRTI